MDIGFLIPSAGRSAAPTSSNALSENGQTQQPAQGKTFSALFKGIAQNVPDEEAFSLSESDDPTEPAPSSDAGKQTTMALVMGVAVVSNSAVRDSQVVPSAEASSAESAQNAQRSSLQGIELVPSGLQNVSMVQIHEAGATGQDSAATKAALSTTTDLPGPPALRPLVVPGQSGEASAMTPKQTVSRTTDESLIRNGRGAPADLPPASLEQPSGSPALPSPPPPGSLISDQGLALIMAHQGGKNLLPTVSVNGGVPSLEQPSTIVQEQGIQETTLAGQSLSVPVIGDSGGRGQDPFEADAEGAGEGVFFHSGENGDTESVMRDNQSPFFNGQFTSARQAQSSIEGEGSSVVTSADHLKMKQAFLGEDHSATMTSGSGKAQIVHVDLPSHDSGPLSVRISMTDQMVHTQFTTDRNDLGAFLFTRQDQLQENLAKSGLELGQFQVHIDQQGRQEALLDRQSRQNGGAPEQQPESQDHNQHAQDRERPIHRPLRALSLFA